MAALDTLLDMIDTQTAPDRMSKRQAFDTLEQLRDELTFRLDALREEVRAEEAAESAS